MAACFLGEHLGRRLVTGRASTFVKENSRERDVFFYRKGRLRISGSSISTKKETLPGEKEGLGSDGLEGIRGPREACIEKRRAWDSAWGLDIY